MLFRQGERWVLTDAAQAPKPGEGALKLDAMEARVEPLVEWRQIYGEAWRIQRDFFYDPNLHGLDLSGTMRKYEPFLQSVSSRGDLNYLMSEMMGELTASHLSVGGGASPEVRRVRGGLLGADFKLENGRWFRASELVRLVLKRKVTIPGFEALTYIRAIPDPTKSNNLLERFASNRG